MARYGEDIDCECRNIAGDFSTLDWAEDSSSILEITNEKKTIVLDS